MGFSTIDYLVVLFYLAGVTVFGLLLSGRQKTAADYFLGGKNIPWWAVLFSVVATETSTLTFISIPAVAYGGDLTFLQITFGYILGRTLVALFFLPKYEQGKLETAYHFLGRRFGPGLRTAAGATFMVTRLLADGVRLFASAIPIALILKLAGLRAPDIQVYFLSIVLIAAVTFLYTYLGGIRAVVWMDVVQMTVYLGGAALAVFLLLSRLPEGLSGALETAGQAGKLRLIDFGFHLPLREFFAQPYTLLTALFGGAVFSVASHGTDQLIVQRLLSTRSLRSGRKALFGSGVVVLLQFSLFLLIGLLLYAFYRGVSPGALGLNSADEVFALFIVKEIPAGISGLIIAAILAAAMSTLSSSINSLASSTLYDLYKPLFRKSPAPGSELRLSRIFSLAWGVVIAGSALGFAVLQIQSGGSRPAVVELGLGIASYTYGGLLGVFLLGLFFRRTRQKDALFGFFCGLTALMFLVDGPLNALLPGEGLSIAWPLYTVVGSAIVIAAASLSAAFSRTKPTKSRSIKSGR